VDLADEGESARIESTPAPPSPTEEELTAAKAWQVAALLDDDAALLI
jgi:hypothetical protein